jgi:hypothetical protein
MLIHTIEDPALQEPCVDHVDPAWSPRRIQPSYVLDDAEQPDLRDSHHAGEITSNASILHASVIPSAST